MQGSSSVPQFLVKHFTNEALASRCFKIAITTNSQNTSDIQIFQRLQKGSMILFWKQHTDFKIWVGITDFSRPRPGITEGQWVFDLYPTQESRKLLVINDNKTNYKKRKLSKSSHDLLKWRRRHVLLLPMNIISIFTLKHTVTLLEGRNFLFHFMPRLAQCLEVRIYSRNVPIHLNAFTNIENI